MGVLRDLKGNKKDQYGNEIKQNLHRLIPQNSSQGLS
jgi:hypothetical protein